MRRFCPELRKRGVAPMRGPGIAGMRCADASRVDVFLAQCLEAWEAQASLCLFSPEWTPGRRAEAVRILENFGRGGAFRQWSDAVGPLVLIATGGTSGQMRFAAHSSAGLEAAVDGFIERFGARAARTVNVLPLYHVGGFMTLLRALGAQQPWRAGSYRDLLERPPAADSRGSLSLVPTQLHRLLQAARGVEHLCLFERIFVGGAALTSADAEQARLRAVPLSPCYGMTETAAMVAALDPDDFARGLSGCGSPLPHASIHFNEGAGVAVNPGRILLTARSLAVGLVPGGAIESSRFCTNDAGFIDANGSLQITERLDRVIMSGGEKVDPGRVERAIQRALEGVEVVVFGVRDADWGQRVVACVGGPVDAPLLDSASWEAELLAHERPKQVIVLEQLPRNAMGKIDREALLKLV